MLDVFYSDFFAVLLNASSLRIAKKVIFENMTLPPFSHWLVQFIFLSVWLKGAWLCIEIRHSC